MQIELNVDMPIGLGDELNGLIHKHLDKAIQDIAKKLRQTAKEEHRYKHKTRNLRNATNVKTNNLGAGEGFEIEISVNLAKAAYGQYIIEGHGSWEGDPFIDNAFAKEESYINSKLEKAVDNAIDEFNRS